jgi:hypothetical protein
MSQWAHINGAIRFDAIRIYGSSSQDPNDFLGNTCTYHDEQATWDKCDVPSGSEGSMQYEIYENPELSQLAAYHVSFRGDLRDRGESIFKEVADYLKRISEGRAIRQGIFEVEVESVETRIYLYCNDTKVWSTVCIFLENKT